jgi:hypothetical protein
MDTLVRYINDGVPTGSFLQAVLSNDLMDAMGRADIESRMDLFEISQFVYNKMPSASWGSRKRVDEWIRSGGSRATGWLFDGERMVLAEKSKEQ